MALDKNILGAAIYSAVQEFDNLTNDQIIAEYGSLEAARQALYTNFADAIITHFKTSAQLLVPGVGLTAGTNAVIGDSTTGTII